MCQCALTGAEQPGQPPVALPPAPAPVAPAPQAEFEVVAPPAQSRLPLLLFVAALLLIAGLGWRFLKPVPGLAIAEGAFQDAGSGFAISPISPNWTQLTSKEKKGDFIEAVSFEKIEGEVALHAALRVFVQPTSLPDFTEAMMGEIQARGVAGLSMAFEGYRHESAQAVSVDNLKSLRLKGSLRRGFEAPAVYKDISADLYEGTKAERVLVSSGTILDYDFKIDALLVPGHERTYLIACLARPSEAAVLQPSFDLAFDSFRVTERPLPYPQLTGNIIKYAALAGIALAALSALIKILRAMYGR